MCCPVVWRHRLWGAVEYAPEVNNGIFFFGEKATVYAADARWIVIPPGKNAKREEFNVQTDMGGNHVAEFIEAVRTRKQPSCTVEDGYRSMVEWDAATEQIVDDPTAAALLKRDYRAPWKHPFAG